MQSTEITALIEQKINSFVVTALTADIRLYKIDFFHSKGNLKIHVLLDKLSDPYGSVNISDCSTFAKKLRESLEKYELETKIDLNYSLEVASAGAERVLTSLQEISRFKSLPMNATFSDPNGAKHNGIYAIEKIEGENLTLMLANCRENRKSGAYKNSKKHPHYTVAFSAIQKIRLHIDY